VAARSARAAGTPVESGLEVISVSESTIVTGKISYTLSGWFGGNADRMTPLATDWR
jgi:hypothetical protein